MSDYARILQLEHNLDALSDQVDDDVGMRLEYLLAEVAELKGIYLEELKPITVGSFKLYFEEYRLNVLNDASIDEALEIVGIDEKRWKVLSGLSENDLLTYRVDQACYHFIKRELKKMEKQPSIKDLSDVTGKVINHFKKDSPKFDFPGFLVHNNACGSFSYSFWKVWMSFPNETPLTNSLQLKIYKYLAELAKNIEEPAPKKDQAV